MMARLFARDAPLVVSRAARARLRACGRASTVLQVTVDVAEDEVLDLFYTLHDRAVRQRASNPIYGRLR